MPVQLYHGDCLEIMPTLADKSVDAIIADIPYGQTACKWDSVIPFEPMWAQLKRIIKPRGAIALFGSQPFTSALVMSNPIAFKQALIWDKGKGTGPLLAQQRPMPSHEDIIIFSYGATTYNPQMTPGRPYRAPRTGDALKTILVGAKTSPANYRQKDNTTGARYPLSVIFYSMHCGSKPHPTAKPVVLLEYLIRTYTNPGETVLDFTMGSGTTGVACVKTGRNFIGIELEREYFEIAERRIAEAQAQPTFFTAAAQPTIDVEQSSFDFAQGAND